MSDKKSSFEITVKRPVAILMIVIAISVFGLVSYEKLSLNLMPDISYPTITVRTEFEGAAPEEVENNISRKVEQALAIVSNLNTISSISRAGISDVILEFRWGTDINDAVQDIREKLDQVFLPKEAKRPVILRYDPTLDPVASFGITSKQNLMFLRNFAEDNIKIRLDKLKGVAAVKVRGGLEEEIHVDIDERKLISLNLNIDRVNQRLANENINLAGGRLKEGSTEYIVRTVNQFSNLDEIRQLIIGNFNGVDIRVNDIGTVTRSYKDREVITRINGKECILLEIYKEADANIVDVAARVKKQLLTKNKPQVQNKKSDKKTNKRGRRGRGMRESFSKPTTIASTLPKDMKVYLLSDQSTFIKSSIDEVKNNAIYGGLLAILVLFLFLKNVKSTVIVSITIPLSIITTFAFMNFFNVSLNIMSLGGIALGVGMLVDNAIVVLESIFRCQEEGDNILKGTIRGVEEVGTAVIASTLTTIAVFFPIVFVEGIAGQIFKDMSLTVVFALLASLMFALFFIPMLASRTFKTGSTSSFSKLKYFLHFNFISELKNDFSNKPIWLSIIISPYVLIKAIFSLILEVVGKIFMLIFLIVLLLVWFSKKIWLWLDEFIIHFILLTFDKGFTTIQDKAYPKLLKSSLNNKKVTVLLIVIAFALTYFSFKNLDAELIPTMHQGEFSVVVTFPVGTPIEKTDKLLTPYEKKLKNINEIQSYFVRIGVEKDSYAKSDEGEHSARIGIKLKPTKNILKSEENAINKIRKLFADLPDAEVRIEYPTLFTVKAPVEVEIHGYNLEKLKKYSNLVLEKLETIEELKDLEVNIRSGNPEIQIIFDREKLSRLGLDIVKVSNLVKNQLLGNVATKYVRGDKRIGIRVKLQNNTKKTLEDLKNLAINPDSIATDKGKQVIPLSSVATINVKEGPSEIRRIDQQRVGVITANISGFGLESINEKIAEKLSEIDHPADIEFVIGGQNKEMESSSKSLMLALLLSVFLVYIVMASQFESLLHPFIIMFTIPLALFGVGITLYALSIPLSVIVFIGMMMLAGIVVNNAIVLIDYINLLREKGMVLRKAIVEAGKVRLRPIVMTTLTTVLGLMPMALGFGEGAEIRRPMAITVIAGLVFSTILTLVVIPTIYELAEERRNKSTEDKKTDNA